MSDVLIYLPPELRQHNVGPSCVFASITTCLRHAGWWKEADIFFSRYRGPGNPWNTQRRLDQCGASYKMLFNCDEQGILEALNKGRPVALTWGGAHFVTLVGKVNGYAYIVDNNSPKIYKVRPWAQFLQEHRRCGGWGVYITNGKVPKAVDVKSLREWNDILKRVQ